jgi:hypothetical protein
VAATVVATRTATKNTNTSRFHRFCYSAADATSSHSSTCIYDWESGSPEPSSSVILHWERMNKVFGSDLHNCLLALSSSSLRLVYLFVGRAPRVVALNANFVKPIAIFIRSSSSRNRKSRTVPTLKSCLTYLIC